MDHNGIIRSIKFRDKLYTNMVQTTPDSEEYFKYKINLQTYNTLLKRLIRQAKQLYYRHIFNKYRDDIRKTWSLIKDATSNIKRNKSPLSILRNGNRITDSKIMADEFNNFFVDIGSSLATNIQYLGHKTYKSYLNNRASNPFCFKPIEELFLVKVIGNLPPKTYLFCYAESKLPRRKRRGFCPVTTKARLKRDASVQCLHHSGTRCTA